MCRLSCEEQFAMPCHLQGHTSCGASHPGSHPFHPRPQLSHQICPRRRHRPRDPSPCGARLRRRHLRRVRVRRMEAALFGAQGHPPTRRLRGGGFGGHGGGVGGRAEVRAGVVARRDQAVAPAARPPQQHGGPDHGLEAAGGAGRRPGVQDGLGDSEGGHVRHHHPPRLPHRRPPPRPRGHPGRHGRHPLRHHLPLRRRGAVCGERLLRRCPRNDL
mmetsp:Transcript_45120/g.94487  ORF Transcript_45120/g.94487 Transcript_45120/m.94487 type:complete len:216 (-) Transcript_45120:35-682(-)